MSETKRTQGRLIVDDTTRKASELRRQMNRNSPNETEKKTKNKCTTSLLVQELVNHLPGLVPWDDPEGWHGEGGGRGGSGWEHVYARGGFLLMCGRTSTIL